MWWNPRHWFAGVKQPVTEPLHIVIYTRQGCHLCEDAIRLLHRFDRRFPMRIEEIDIDTDAQLAVLYGEKVPVIALAGKPRLWGRINEAWLQRLLEGESRRTPT